MSGSKLFAAFTRELTSNEAAGRQSRAIVKARLNSSLSVEVLKKRQMFNCLSYMY